MYIIYFLESIQDNTRHYIGYTTNLTQRIKTHNNGSVSSTKRYRPWKIIYAEAYIHQQDARGREKFLKSGSGWKYLKKQLTHHFNT
ncbi:GIY-YIG nuclease family protein [Patescibacteria group bacterium]|nr:GIY-YIG nuclease family protein [Patescibacteria group bacterium]MBU1721868.1 GIY-YIG nuclease family protein [Patescibacteria group bacterium]MBU1901326.1 GIY-YIG nuclease family protein [Patescibacteria group bacterium]